jgi:hypothetical protein
VTTVKTEKEFDCIAFKDRVQSEIYQDIKDMSISEQVQYYRDAVANGPFAEHWKKLSEETERRKKARWSERPQRDE